MIVILGPTASGKSDVAMCLAEHMNTQLISADSAQIYRGMDIGTAKPTKEEQTRVMHHMIDIVDVDEPFTVSDFQENAFGIICDLHNYNMSPIIVGGTGLYIHSLVYHLDFTKTQTNHAFRDKMSALIAEKGLDYLYRRLEKKDAGAAARIHPNDEKRIIRALEVLENEGGGERPYDFLKPREDYDFRLFGFNFPREILYDRINQRVDIMMEKGLVGEVKALYETYGSSPVALKAIGYKEIISYLKGDISQEEAVRLIKRNSRHFAKRQITWFKRDKRIIWLDPQEKNCFKNLLSGIE
ncbi:MAG: tRNA (adenosine(37)-N6)-dimethylallyltransferase MiaA [Eubacteriales bacterium]